MKRNCKRLLALCLCALMLCSDVAGLLPRAQAAPASATAGTAAGTGVQNNFQDPSNGRPNLFVDFLGDNNNYVYDQTGVNSGLTKLDASSLSAISVPAPYDQSSYTNTTMATNSWQYYKQADVVSDTVFWVGLGVDRVELLQLLEDGQGLSSLEAGFYYDSTVIEPYIDPTFLPSGVNLSTATDEQLQAAYRETIQKANINNASYPANTQWSGNYTVRRALTDLAPETDPVTREELETPTIDDILQNNIVDSAAGQPEWKMTYVSLELEDLETMTADRLVGRYQGVDDLPQDGDGNPITPASASGNEYIDDDPSKDYDYNYLLLIPFRLKKFGSQHYTSLRLVRDATHLSIGAGTWGVDAYGAWERTTTRNPAVTAVADSTAALGVEGHGERDLKLLTRFAGDLKLFSAGRVDEARYSALLHIIGGGGSLNRAKLTVDGDPGVWPVWADTDGETIGGLQGGQGMYLDVHTQENYVATVTVTYTSGGGTVYHAYTQVLDGAQDDAYRFVMPSCDVTVTVTFTYQSGENVLVYLTELPQPGDTGYAVGNETTIQTTVETINSFSPVSAHPNYNHPTILDHPATTPVAKAKKDQKIQIEVATHADYVAVVRIFDFKTQDYVTTATINATGLPGVTANTTPGADYGKIVMPNGGTIELTMGSSDLDVEVTYQKGENYQATLEVYNPTGTSATNFDLNTAQLVYDRYDSLNLSSRAYSSVVYHQLDSGVPVDDHRAIKGNDILPWVSTSQASLSGSLGGDTGRTGKTWNPKDLPTPEDEVTGGRTIMALLAGSSSQSDLQSALNGLDLATTKVNDGSANGLVGLRKNAAGELYGDADVSAAASGDADRPTIIEALWALREYIEADTTTGGLRDTYLKTVYKSDSTVAYTYYDLTAAQVQSYLLELSRLPNIKAENDLAYRMAFRRYQTVKADYDRLSAIPAYSGMAVLQAPAKNLSTTVTNGEREYQDLDYKTGYLAAYNSYLDDYEQYLIDLEANAGTSGAGAPTNIPSFTTALPGKKSIALKSDTDAVSALSGYTWTTAAVPTEVPTTGLTDGGTIETRAGRTVYVVLEADSAYELDKIEVYERGAATTTPVPYAAVGNPLSGVSAAAVTGYQNVYAFTMPSQDCVVRVTYKLRGTRKLNINYVGAAGLDDNEAVVEAYAVADPAAVTPDLVSTTNKGYTKTPLPLISVTNNGATVTKAPTTATYTSSTDTYAADPVEDTLKGSVVTIRTKAAKGYEVKSVEAKNSDGTSITVSKRPADDPADGYVYTFTIADDARTDDVTLTITYGPEKEEEYTATIRSTTEGTAVNNANEATWYVVNGTTVTTPTVISAVKPATHLTGHVSVAPGYYIKSITAWGASGSYAFTCTGNGYNNGYGTTLTGTNVPIDIYVDMPHEDLIVDVVFAKGPPDPAPSNTLTLIVKDDDNTETDLSKAADNYAYAKVYNTKPADWVLGNSPRTTDSSTQELPAAGDGVPGDVLGKNDKKGNNTLSSRKYVNAGQWVVVDFSPHVEYFSGTSTVDPDKSYYVSSVTVGPSNVGAALIWEGPHTVSFYMPAGSAAVTVEFSKYPSNGRQPDYPLTVRETYMDQSGALLAADTNGKSYVTMADSDTIRLWYPTGPYNGLTPNDNPEIVPPTTISTATGAATAGEEVTMTFQVEKDQWYVQSIVLVSNGAVTRLTGTETPAPGTSGALEVYTVKFHMPASPAEFIVHYREGKKPDVQTDYAFTLTIDDPDNVLGTDDNHITADFHDPTNTTIGHAPLYVGKVAPTGTTHLYSGVTAVQHIHSGDVVTLETTLAGGYYLEYMIVNPAGIGVSPVWSSATTASFVMPKQGVAVVARVVKGTPQKYTANLILRYEDANGNEILPTGKTIHDIGKGTFTFPTSGTLNNYAKDAVYSTAQDPGTTIGYDLYAFDGYYIDRITVEPVSLGVTGTLSGSCGYQDGQFVMPYASVNVNVWFKSGWPDEIPYDLTIKVHDSSLSGSATPNATDNNNAKLRTVTGRTPAPSIYAADREPVFGGQTKVIDRSGYPLDRDVVILDIDAKTGFYVEKSSISITDSLGNRVDWWYVPGGIAFVQPPRAVTAEITFRSGAPTAKHTATLHLSGYVDTDTSADKDVINDYALLSADSANSHAQTTTQASGVTAPPVAVNADGAVITDLYHGDTLDLTAMPGAGRHITAAYAVTSAGTVIPIYGYDAAGTTVTSDPAQYVPGKPGTLSPAAAGTKTKGAFAMPEDDVDVYVKYDSGTIPTGSLAVDLVVSGPVNSGDATAVIDEADPTPDQSMTVSAPGMDSRFTTQGNEVVVTFDPDTANDYGITALEVTNNATGEAVPYAWISVLQDPPTIDNSTQDNSNLWSGTAPAPGITHPTWTPNPDKQIKLTVPSGGVTIKVTYGKLDVSTVYRAQVVVQDPLAGTSSTSKNNAWLSQQAGSDANDPTLKKLQEAKPGEWVDLDITVHPGWRIEFVKVIPQSFGIVPGLPVGTDMGGGVTYYLHDQKTGFYMPGGDCTVYVKFVEDDTATKSATLVVNGAPSKPDNYATIESPISGQKGPVYVQGTSRSVDARPGVDWVTSDYYWDTATSSIASITVVRAGNGSAVPFTQTEDPSTGHGQITFPMVNDDVVVTITYQNDPKPVGQEVVLHVIDKDRLTNSSAAPILGDANNDGTMDNYGQLSYTVPTGYPSGYSNADTGKIAPGVPESTYTIYVPAGQTVDVTACSDAANLDNNGKVYIESAYVLFTQSGQMVNFNLTPDSLLGGTGSGYSGLHTESSFVVHPGRNDVYITLTRTEPKTTQHSAVLMLKSPSADTQSEAGIHADQSVAAWSDASAARRDKVRANDPNDTHAYVTATDGEKITISVEPASGYVIDYIQITPLGFPLDTDPVYQYARNGNTITFDMPHCNVGITVYLKRGSDQEHTATLHFLQDPSCVANGNPPQDEDYAKLTWTPTGQPATSIYADEKGGALSWASTPYQNVSSMKIREGSTVTLDVTLDGGDVIMAAFAVRKDTGSIVPLTPVYPTATAAYPGGLNVNTGIEGVGESASGAPNHDNTLSDATATFTMPMGDVEVYVVVTTEPPAGIWHTVALIATDHSPTGNNSGYNEGDLWNNGAPGDVRVAKSDNVPTIAWITLSETDTFSVLPRAAAGYRFDPPAVMTGNDGTTRNLSSLYASYLYEVTAVTCNQVVRIDFESSDALELTVEIEDPDNPGNGTVEQEVTADPAGTTPPTLRLTSNSVAGSYQIISGVTPGDTVALTATPEPGYDFYAKLHTIDGTVTDIPMTDGDGDGVWDGSFTMPANNARVVVTFYKSYRATLELVNRISGDTTGQATMSEDKRGLAPLSVHSLSTIDSFDSIPNGDNLDAQVTGDLTGRRVTGLLTVNGSTTLLPATPSGIAGDNDHYKHTIDRADAKITLVLDDDTEHPNAYLAAVQVVNRPAALTDAQMPTIANTTDPTITAGTIWTVADSGHGIKVHVTVPGGYKAEITTDAALDLDGSGGVTAKTLTADGDTTFTMPAANVQVTVTYIRTQYDLTLHVVDTSGLMTPPTATLTAGAATLTYNGDSAAVAQGTALSLSAAPVSGAKIKYIFYQIDGQATTFITVPAAGSSYSGSLPNMPGADMDVTVVYASTAAPPPAPDPDPQDYYIATAVKDDPANDPGNQVLSIRNTSRSALLNGSALPGVSPHWVAGYAGDAVQVSFQAAAGYYVQVTAKTAGGASLPVVQIGGTGAGAGMGTATAAFPNPGEDIIITVTFTKTKPYPDSTTQNVALQLVQHDALAGNAAQTTDFTGSALLDLSLDGTYANHAPGYTQAKDPVERIEDTTAVGNDLRTLANWANGYRVVRMTVAVRNTSSGMETPEADLLVSTYGGSATTRCPVPTLGADEIPVVRVYYGNVYTATFHLVGDDPTDGHTATDVLTGTTNTVSYTNAYDVSSTAITKPIQDHLDRMENYQGDGTEDIQTSVTAGAGRRVVDVVWESDLTGAASAVPNGTLPSDGAGRYDFTMPADDVDFYAIYETEPTDPKDRTYIAKVAFAADSAHLGDSDNAVSIKNLTDTAASGGKYWTSAKDGDSVEITVKVAPGYQAEIITAKVDDSAQVPAGRQWADDFHYYITRTHFVPNLTAGKTATFSMPKDTDATVTIRYTKGYDLTLAVTDKTLLDGSTYTGTNDVDLAYDAAEHLRWTHDGTTSANTQSYTPSSATLVDKEGNKSVGTDVTVYDPNVKVKVTRYTPFTGTVTLTKGSASPYYPFTMPYEDTIESVLLRDQNAADDLLAKVELAGDSDINGNDARPIKDATDQDGLQPNGTTVTPAANITTTGTIWTTTDGAHVIDLTLSVAKGYVAKIKVRRDNANYYNNPNDPSQWDYLDAADYQFQRVWDQNVTTGGTTTTQTQTAALTTSAGITEVQIGYSADALPQAVFSDSVSGEQHFRFVMPEDRTASGSDPGDAESDVTVIVTFEKVSQIPKPFDPRNDDLHSRHPSFLEEGFIYGENRGDYAIVEIPTLAKDESSTVKKLYDTDNYGPDPVAPATQKDAATEIKRFNFYIRAVGPGGEETYTRLDPGKDIVLVPYDEDALLDPGDPYNYYTGAQEGMWTGPETWKDTSASATQKDFVGSKFRLYPTEPDSKTNLRTAGAQALYEMLNNEGSLETYTDGGVTKYRTTLFVQAEDATDVSDYTEVWIRPWFALGVKVVSYGPTHELTGELYRLMTQDELDTASGYKDANGNVNTGGITQTVLDPEDFRHYKWDEDDAPDFTDSEVVEEGSGKWLQILRIRSSELLGGFDSNYDPSEQVSTPAQSGDRTLLDNVLSTETPTYALVLKKAANLPYTRIKIDLDPDSAVYAAPNAPLTDYYENGDYTTRTFMLRDTVYLIAGDVDENGRTKIQDYDYVYDFVYRNRPRSDLQTEPTEPAYARPAGSDAAWDQYDKDMESWAVSVYNPESMAYRCDLDGDRHLTVQDLNIVNSRYDYNRDETDYYWYKDVSGVWTGILPFGIGKRDTSYTALFALNAAVEGEVFADTYWDETVDPAETLAVPLETFYIDAQGGFSLRTEAPETPAEEDPVPAETHDERLETPLGEEALDHRAVLPGVSEGGGEVTEEEPAAPPPEPEEAVREEPAEAPASP